MASEWISKSCYFAYYFCKQYIFVYVAVTHIIITSEAH